MCAFPRAEILRVSWIVEHETLHKLDIQYFVCETNSGRLLKALTRSSKNAGCRLTTAHGPVCCPILTRLYYTDPE